MIETTGPLVLILVPMLTGVLAYVLRRWRSVPPILGASVTLLLGLILVLLPSGQSFEIAGQEIALEQSVDVLGRALVLQPSDRPAMGYLFFTAAALFLAAWRFDRGGLFVPMGLGMLGLLCGVLVVHPLIYAVLFFQIAVVLSVFPLYAEEDTPVRGGLRYLTFYILALPGLMISHWLLDLYVYSPDQVSLLETATILIGFSFVLMLGLVPFHAWVPAIGSDGAPLMSAFLYTAMTGGVWFLLFEYLRAYPWLAEHGEWQSLLTVLGVATAVVGGLLGAVRRSPGTLIGYIVMVDTGLSVVALGDASQRSVGAIVLLLFARTVGAVLMTAGLEGLRSKRDASAELPDGVGWKAPWSTAAVLIGGLSLVGLPPTVGFAARWALLTTVARSNPIIGLVLLMASIAPVVGLIQWVVKLLRRPRQLPGVELEEAVPPIPSVREPVADVAVLLVFVAATFLLGVFPQWIAAAADDLARYMALF
ncbi:MAG: hypothetical protein JXD18_13535 [Anaerolineae bacterium]|nr:hypothetical protein [Anaerolineae bacterium]